MTDFLKAITFQKHKKTLQINATGFMYLMTVLFYFTIDTSILLFIALPSGV